MQFASSWGASELRVVNLFALRSTDATCLKIAEDPVGPENDGFIEDEFRKSDLMVVAWGNHGRLFSRADEVRRMIEISGAEVLCLGVNQTGEPVHPLYVRSAVRLSPYTG